VVCAFLGLALVVIMSKVFELPAGAAGGILAGRRRCRRRSAPRKWPWSRARTSFRRHDRRAGVGMIALGYGVTYIWGTVGIILICKYLPRWWGIDAKKAAKDTKRRTA
jgi:putative transport protein